MRDARFMDEGDPRNCALPSPSSSRRNYRYRICERTRIREHPGRASGSIFHRGSLRPRNNPRGRNAPRSLEENTQYRGTTELRLISFRRISKKNVPKETFFAQALCSCDNYATLSSTLLLYSLPEKRPMIRDFLYFILFRSILFYIFFSFSPSLSLCLFL